MDTAIDTIRETYGNGIITRAGFLDSDVSPMTGTKQDEGAPLMRSHL
jgi:hypothetical protein